MNAQEKLDAVLTHVNAVINATEEIISENDSDYLDDDELYDYAVNEGMNDLANQILDILNK
jgi:hypothetical protein